MNWQQIAQEYISDLNSITYKKQVPGGWLVMIVNQWTDFNQDGTYTNRKSTHLTFVSDPEYKWI